MKNLLLICYDFPPNSGIGGRRWAKHAKALANLGHQVHVIKAEAVPGHATSGWTQDVAHPNIHVHTLPRTYPTAISHPKRGLLASLRYRWHSRKLKEKEAGTIYDIAIGWDRILLAKAESLINEYQITHILATGAPFNVLYFAAKLKSTHPELFYLADFRDPWLTAKNYGMADLTKERMQAEVAKHKLVLERADLITSTNPHMREEIIKANPANSLVGRFEVIPHCYDPDDLEDHLNSSTKKSDSIRLVYGGALYLGLHPFISEWVDQLLAVKEKSPDLYAQVEIRIFTPDLQYAHLFEQVKDVVYVSAPIGKELFRELEEADGILILLAEHNKDNFTTKFAESLPFRKPLIYVGAEGEARRFVLDNALGVDANTCGWEVLLNSFPTWESTEEKEQLVARHSLTNVGAQLNKLLA